MNQPTIESMACLCLSLLLVTAPVACQTRAPKPIPTKQVESIWTRPAGEDWPSFLGPRGDGTSAEKGVQPELWKPHPKLLWQEPLGMSYGGPAVVKGRVLQFDRSKSSK